MSRVMRFGKSVIVGCVHNSREGKMLVRRILDSEKFDYYLLELNRDNYEFIKNNNFHFSEFYDIMNSIDRSKIKLIDIDYKNELLKNSNCKSDLLNNYISYELAKYTFYYMHEYLNETQMRNHPIYNSHIKQREYNMLQLIKKYKEYKTLTIIGLYHFDYIYNNLLI